MLAKSLHICPKSIDKLVRKTSFLPKQAKSGVCLKLIRNFICSK